jgi:hypothetical protein
MLSGLGWVCALPEKGDARKKDSKEPVKEHKTEKANDLIAGWLFTYSQMYLANLRLPSSFLIFIKRNLSGYFFILSRNFRI